MFLRLGEAQMSLAKYKEATASLEKAVTRLDSAGDSAKDLREEARYRLAEAYTQTGKYQPALKVLTAMLADKPHDGVLYLKESQVLENLDKRPEALEALLIGITKASDPAPLHEQAKLLIRKLQPADFPCRLQNCSSAPTWSQPPLVDEHAAYLSAARNCAIPERGRWHSQRRTRTPAGNTSSGPKIRTLSSNSIATWLC